MLLTDKVLAAVVIVGCGIEVLSVLTGDNLADERAIDVANGCALVSPAVSKEVMTDYG